MTFLDYLKENWLIVAAHFGVAVFSILVLGWTVSAITIPYVVSVIGLDYIGECWKAEYYKMRDKYNKVFFEGSDE